MICLLVLVLANQSRRDGVERESVHQLQTLTSALREYISRMRSAPSACGSRNGVPTLSWRVVVLGDIETALSPPAFVLDEPWDSETNSQFHNTFRRFFYSARAKRQFNEATNYVAIVDKNTLLQTETYEIENPTDFDVAVIMELRDSDVHWCEPSDLNIEQAILYLKSNESPVHVGFLSGRVIELDNSTSPEKLRQMFELPIEFRSIPSD